MFTYTKKELRLLALSLTLFVLLIYNLVLFPLINSIFNLDTNKIYPCDYSDRYVENSIHTLVLSDNTVITLQKFRNDTTKYGIHIINQVGFFNHNPICL